MNNKKKKELKNSSIKKILIIIAIVVVTAMLGIFSVWGAPQVIRNTQGAGNGEVITYNTSGDDAANYVDGDVNGEKSQWVKNGDTWTYTFYVDDPNAQWYIWEDTETLMEGYTADFTESNMGRIFEEETLVEFTPESNMSSKTDSDGKTVYTWLDSENAYKVTDNGDGTYTKVTTKLSFTITNTKQGAQVVPTDPDTGSLTISKNVKDSDGNVLDENSDNTNFQFTVTLSAGTADSRLIDGTKIFGNVVFKNRQAKISLKAGNSITISNLPAGVTYNIVENNYTEYETSYENQSGTIAKDEEKVTTITNTKKKAPEPVIEEPEDPNNPEDPEQKFVDITIVKEVIGNNEVNEEYTVELELNNLKENKTYELSDGTRFRSDSVGSANVTLKLTSGQNIVIKNIPVGTKYKAFEYAGDYISSYVITDSNNKGLIANTANKNTKVNTAISTATETADEDENVTITFTNKRIVTENLKLTKTVTDEQDTNNYMFDIEFGNMEEGQAFNSTAGRVIAEPNGKAELSVYLANGESVEFYDIPVGTIYRVKELASSSIASYEITDKNNSNKIEKASNSNTQSKKALSTEFETVNQGEDVTINFINNTVNQEPDSVEVSMGVSKNVKNKEDELVENCADSFDFELIANDENAENYPMPEKTNVKITGNGTESFGKITFTQTGTYTYKITEKAGNSEDYEYDNSEYIVTFEVTNPEGLLEVTRTIKKNGFNGDEVIFTNKTDKYEPEPENPDDPVTPDEPENPEDPENPEKPENPGKPEEPNKPENPSNSENENKNGEEKESKPHNLPDRVIEKVKENLKLPKTGQTRIAYVAIIFIIVISAGVIVYIKISNNKKNK